MLTLQTMLGRKQDENEESEGKEEGLFNPVWGIPVSLS